MQTTTEKINIQNCDDWELVCVLACYSYNPKLPASVSRDVYEKIYANSDGYGMKGFVPPQGYDWSGIRDSSPEAKKNMAKVARRFLKSQNIEELEYEQRKY